MEATHVFRGHESLLQPAAANWAVEAKKKKNNQEKNTVRWLNMLK